MAVLHRRPARCRRLRARLFARGPRLDGAELLSHRIDAEIDPRRAQRGIDVGGGEGETERRMSRCGAADENPPPAAGCAARSAGADTGAGSAVPTAIGGASDSGGPGSGSGCVIAAGSRGVPPAADAWWLATTRARRQSRSMPAVSDLHRCGRAWPQWSVQCPPPKSPLSASRRRSRPTPIIALAAAVDHRTRVTALSPRKRSRIDPAISRCSDRADQRVARVGSGGAAGCWHGEIVLRGRCRRRGQRALMVRSTIGGWRASATARS